MTQRKTRGKVGCWHDKLLVASPHYPWKGLTRKETHALRQFCSRPVPPVSHKSGGLRRTPLLLPQGDEGAGGRAQGKLQESDITRFLGLVKGSSGEPTLGGWKGRERRGRALEELGVRGVSRIGWFIRWFSLNINTVFEFP